MSRAGIRPSPASWIPSAAWLAPGYAEWQPPAALRRQVACLWLSVIPDRPQGSGLILPDGCSDLIWEQGAGASVAGPDTGPFIAGNPAPGAVIVGIRFRPAAGGQVLGLPLSELRDRRVPLEDVLPGLAPSSRLPAGLTPAQAGARLLDLTGTLIMDGAADPAIAHAATLLRDPAVRTEEVADRVGLSERQFRRRSQAAAGYGPKTLQRVLRFQRFVRLLDASRDLPDLAGAAARAGYADQPHLTRECRALSGHTPAALHRLRRPVLAVIHRQRRTSLPHDEAHPSREYHAPRFHRRLRADHTRNGVIRVTRAAARNARVIAGTITPVLTREFAKRSCPWRRSRMFIPSAPRGPSSTQAKRRWPIDAGLRPPHR